MQILGYEFKNLISHISIMSYEGLIVQKLVLKFVKCKISFDWDRVNVNSELADKKTYL